MQNAGYPDQTRPEYNAWFAVIGSCVFVWKKKEKEKEEEKKGERYSI